MNDFVDKATQPSGDLPNKVGQTLTNQSAPMQYYEQASAILEQIPLPDDAFEQFDRLAKLATGDERRFINIAVEAIYASATERQIKMWIGKG